MLYEKADRLSQSSIVGGSVQDSILVVGNENRINQNQYILPSEPSPPLFVGVPPMPAHFVGREALVTGLVGRLVTTGRVAISAEGLPGVGKTALAVALAHDQRVLEHFCDGVLWAGLGQKPDLLGVLARWGEALGCDVTTEKSEAARTQAVKDAIGQRRLLLVIDDAWDVEAAGWLRVGGPNSCHLLTTRDQSIARAFASAEQVQTVPVLPEAPAFRLLQMLAPEACAADGTQARHLAQVVGGLPLALSLLGGYLAIPEHSYFPELAVEALEEMRNPKRRLELASRRLGTAEHATLQEVIELSLTELPIEAVSAFHALGAFASKPTSFDRQAAEAVTEASLRTLALLIARNLLEQADQRLALHQVLADVARTQTKTDAMLRHREHYLAQVKPNREDWRRIEAIYQQIQWAWSKLPAERILIDYVDGLHLYQERRGLWHEKLVWTEKGLEVAQSNKLHRIEGTFLNNIAAIYDGLGQKEKALAYYQRALSIRKQINDRYGLAMTLNNIGQLFDSLGKLQNALDYYTQALPIREEVGDWSGLATTLNNIAHVFLRLGLSQKALEYYERALGIWQKIGNRTATAVCS